MWRTVKLGDILSLQNGYAFKSTEYEDDGYFVMRITNVQQGCISTHNPKYIRIDKGSNLEKFILDEGDILVSLTGDVGRVGVIENEHLPAALNQRVARVTGVKRGLVNRDFLFAYMNSDAFRLQVEDFAHGAAQANVSTKDILSINVSLPPLAEQQRIVAKLDAAFAEIDKAIEVAEFKRIEVERLKAALLSTLLEGEGWEKAKLKDCCRVFVDGDWIETKDQSDKGIRLVQTGNIKIGKFAERHEKARYISEETFKRLNCTEVKEGDILVSRLPEPVGRACIIPRLHSRAITAVDCTIIRTNKNLAPAYLNYYMQSTEYFARVQEKVTGSTRQRVSRKKLGEVEVTIPPFVEQQRIVAKLDAAFSEIERANASVCESKAHYQALKSAILAQELQPPQSEAA